MLHDYFKLFFKSITLLLIWIVLPGCAMQQTASLPSNALIAARPAVQAEPSLNMAPSKTGDRLAYGNDPSLERAFARYQKTGKAPNIITDGFVKFAYQSGQQPIVNASPFEETIISLEKGERFTNVSSGDPSRWSYAVAVSGAGNEQQQHILVKPSSAGISTNIVITTDKRLYNLRLVSTQNSTVTRNASFWYPAEMTNAAKEAAKQAEESVNNKATVQLDQLNFDYNISCGNLFCVMPAWRPVRVFDDGAQTYIQFPSAIRHRDLPVLFIARGNGQELVNYRSKSPYFVVDRLFKQAVLVMGVGSSQERIMITNQRYI